MSIDPSVLAAMSAAVAADPANTALRSHLAGLLHQSGKYAEALTEYAQVLAAQPDNLATLEGAAASAAAAGEAARADSYRRLYEALRWQQTKGLLDNLEEPALPPGPAPRQERPYAEETRAEPLRASEFGEPPPRDLWEAERPRITLVDVAGMEAAKRRLRVAFLDPMRNPEMARLYGKSLRGGLILYGPPGCGKTFLARAAAGELGAKFISIGLNDVLDMWIGKSEKNLHEIFETARRNSPCVLFFDEVDALGRKRTLQRMNAGTGVINQLLSEMDGVSTDNDGVFILAATNHPWDVDEALRRPGRFDRMVLVLPPDKPAREAILSTNMRNRPVDRLDISWLADRTEGFSGADVAHLCESAVEFALDESLSTGRARPVQMNDFKRALKEVHPSVRSWLETAKNYVLYANEGGTYDDLMAYLRTSKIV
jgi:SpoVK/Ycf46/Vps4 family AAA+-type ATPase